LQVLKDQLTAKGFVVCWLQGEMPQDKRNQAMERFKSGQVKILVATDVAARGIDVPDVSHVINFDMPRKADVYVHRIGRTGRAGAKGTAISLVEAHDFEIIGKVIRYTGENMKARVIDALRPKHKAPEKRAKKKKKSSKTKK
jgi:ATP-dependent RNA helicase SrmB